MSKKSFCPNRYKLIAVGIVPQTLQSDVIAHLDQFPSERRIIKGKSITTHLVVYRSELNKWFETLKTHTKELCTKTNQTPVDAAIQFLQKHQICSPETLSKISKPLEYLLLLEGISEVGLAKLTLSRLILQTSKSLQDLLDIEKAVQTIQEWKDDYPQYCFENCLPVSLRATIQYSVQDDIRKYRSNAISQSLQKTTTQIIANESWGHDLSQIDFLPTEDQFTPEAKTLLNSLAQSVLKSPEATPSRQFLQLLVYSQGFSFGQELLLSLIPSGPSKADLDAEILKLDASIQSSYNRFITHVRTRINASTGLDQTRWNSVEKRLGEQVVMIVKATQHVQLTNLQKNKIVELVEKWSTTLAGTCSVGTDIRLLEANDSLAGIL